MKSESSIPIEMLKLSNRALKDTIKDTHAELLMV